MGEFADATIDEVLTENALLQTIADNEYSLVIADVLTPGTSITEAIKKMKMLRPKTPVLVLSMYPFDHYAVSFLKAGANGYLTASLVPEKLITAVRTVLKGKTFPARQALVQWY